MSYLSKFSPRNDSLPCYAALRWRGTSGTVYFFTDSGDETPDHVQVRFPRYTKFGTLLRFNSECERQGIANEIRRKWPHVSNVTFVSV